MALETLLTQRGYLLPEIKNRQGRRLPNMFELPSENPEEPGLPDHFHYLQPHLLSQTFRIKVCCFSCGDMYLYYDEDNTSYYKRPDWFVALVPPMFCHFKRESFLVWQEKAVPFMIVEILSFSTRKEDLYKTKRKPGKAPCKLEVYEDILKVPYYIVYDEEGCDFLAYHWEEGGYVEMVHRDGRVAIPEVGLELGTWGGAYEKVIGNWLRFFDAEGKMIPTPVEESALKDMALDQERAEKEKERAARKRSDMALDQERAEKERLLRLLKEAGGDPQAV